MNRVALYIRVSTEEQVRHGYSIQSQKERLIEYCKQKGYKVINIYIDEGKSARTKLKNRKELLKLVEDAKLKIFDLVVFWRLDRWFRNIADYYKINTILETNNIFWECSDEEYSTTTANGRLYLNIKLSISQNESDQTSERIRFNFDNMTKNKIPIWGGNVSPFGYTVVGKKKDKKLVKDENTKHIVEDMFKHFETYNSMRKTLVYINEKYDIAMNYDSIRKIFRNKLYVGIYRETEDFCDPYITLEQYEENRDRITYNIRNSNRGYEYIFSGMIKCPYCKNNMSGFNHVTTVPKYNKRYSARAYRCNKSYGTRLCPNRSPIFERTIEQYLTKNIISDLEKFKIEVINIEKIKETNTVNVSKLKQKQNRLNELYIEGRITRERYDNDYQLLKSTIEKANEENKNRIDLTVYDGLLDKNALELYNKLDNIHKRAFWRRYIDFIERDEHKQFKVHFKKIMCEH
jgi:site-specific DNA recombinase